MGMAKAIDPKYDQEFLMVAVESFMQQRSGHFLTYAYGEPIPESDYVGGGKHWVNLSQETDVYKFPQGHRFLLSNKAGEISSAILDDTKSSLSGLPWHFISLTPGADFAGQDGLLVNGFHNAAQAHDEAVDILTIADGNRDFRQNATEYVKRNHFQPSSIAESDHNIFTTSLGDIHPTEIKKIKRRSVVVWAGGTLGNVGLKDGEIGFPDEAYIDNLQKQVDHSAEECYIVVLHNAFNKEAVLKYYSSPNTAQFVLSPLYRIKDELPTENFDPSKFEYQNSYDEDLEVVIHKIISTEKQTPFIGRRGFALQKGDLATIAGYSGQITRDRMGAISSRAGFARVTSFGHRLNGNPDAQVIATILKATPDLMSALRQGQKFRSHINPI